jgi:cobalamin biosynthesis Mg chelatase CobN
MQQWMFKYICLAILIATAVNTVSAVPTLPMVVSGAVHINGEPAPAGTEIKALIAGEIKGNNIISQQGVYGIVVEYGQGTVELYVNNIKVQSINWSSEPQTLNLSVTMTVNLQPIQSTQSTQHTQTNVKNASTVAQTTASTTTTVEPKTAISAPKSTTPQATFTQDKVEKSEALKTPVFGLLLSFLILFAAGVIIRRKKE